MSLSVQEEGCVRVCVHMNSMCVVCVRMSTEHIGVCVWMNLSLGKLDQACHDGPTALHVLDFKRDPPPSSTGLVSLKSGVVSDSAMLGEDTRSP